MNHENLTKENFWNEMQEKYPQSMAVFCVWIDEYKKENNWNDLFGNDQITQRKEYWADIKFHHLPIAMQYGIWQQFVEHNGHKQFSTELIGDLRHTIKMYLKWAENKISGK